VASPRNTFLFGDTRIATATSGRSKYGHTFGGPHDRNGTSREDCNGLLIHLLHRLDLTDPARSKEVKGDMPWEVKGGGQKGHALIAIAIKACPL
jgi:hypothetical protein